MTREIGALSASSGSVARSVSDSDIHFKLVSSDTPSEISYVEESDLFEGEAHVPTIVQELKRLDRLPTEENRVFYRFTENGHPVSLESIPMLVDVGIEIHASTQIVRNGELQEVPDQTRTIQSSADLCDWWAAALRYRLL